MRMKLRSTSKIPLRFQPFNHPTYLKFWSLAKNKFASLGKVGTEGLIDGECFFMLRENLTKILILRSKSGLSLDRNEEASLKVDELVEIGKDEMNGLGRDDRSVRLQSPHVGLQVLQILNVASLCLQNLIHDLCTVVRWLGLVRVAFRCASGPEQSLVLHTVQNHAHGFDDLTDGRRHNGMSAH